MSTTTVAPQNLEEALATITPLIEFRDMLNANDYREYAEDYFSAKASGDEDFEDDYPAECPTFPEMVKRWAWDEEDFDCEPGEDD